MLKYEIKNILINFLVDEEILDPPALSSILITQTDLQLRELEVQQQIQQEKLRLEQEERIRVEQLEWEDKEKIEMEERERKTNSENQQIDGLWISYVALSYWVLPNLFKWWHWVDPDLFYGKVKYEKMLIHKISWIWLVGWLFWV